MKRDLFKSGAPHGRRSSSSLVMCSMLAVAFPVCDPATAEHVTIQQIVLSTDELPSGDGTFSGLGFPSINAQGAIAGCRYWVSQEP